MAADVPIKSALFRHQLEGPRHRAVFHGTGEGEPFNFTKTGIVLYCVFPGSEMLAPEQPEQELTAVDSNGVRLRVRSVRLWEGVIEDKSLRRVNVSLNLKDVSSPGARRNQVSGTLFSPFCAQGWSSWILMVELKESGVSIPVPDPIAVRRALENNRWR